MYKILTFQTQNVLKHYDLPNVEFLVCARPPNWAFANPSLRKLQHANFLYSNWFSDNNIFLFYVVHIVS